jgi:hypothetical protein
MGGPAHQVDYRLMVVATLEVMRRQIGKFAAPKPAT